MTNYLKKTRDDLPETYQGRYITLAAKHLFKVNKTTWKLSEKDAQAFHTIVEKLLVLCKRARTDILTGVDFFTMRVREPEKTTTRNYRGYLNISTVRGILYSPWNLKAPEQCSGGWMWHFWCTTSRRATWVG